MKDNILGLNKRQHDLIFPEVALNQGGKFCNWCGLTGFQLAKLGRADPVLIIDHKNNQNDDRWTNLQLLCRSCNQKKSRRIDPPRRTATPEMQRGDRNMKATRLYIRGLIETPNYPKEKLEYYTLIDDLAENLDCSQQSIKNYLAKLTAKTYGYYVWETPNDGNTYLVPK